jgi:hypothetical protein
MVVPSPSSAASASGKVGAWQDGGLVVIEKGAKLPRRCFKCNAPVTDSMKQIELQWVPGKVAASGVFGLINNAIADTYGQSVIVRYGRCPAHRTGWTKWRFAGACAAVGVAGAVVFFVGAQANEGAVAIPGAMTMVGGLAIAVWAMTLSPPLKVVKLQKNRAWIKGFSRSYVESLPMLTEAADVDASLTGQALEDMAGGRQGGGRL